MKISLCITTYNRPDFLEKVLSHIRRQKHFPDEVLVCDDGSGEKTRSLIEREAATFPVPLRHLWQEDEGWRVSRSRNMGIREARNAYLVFIDGDCVPHPKFIQDHARLARPGHLVFGDRVHVKEPHVADFRCTFWGIWAGVLLRKLAKRGYALRNPFEQVRQIRFEEMNALSLADTVVGCNMAFWKADAEAVNGFDESPTGWSLEDVEFSARMLATGLTGLKVHRQATVFHLDHPMQPYDRKAVLKPVDRVFNGAGQRSKTDVAMPEKPPLTLVFWNSGSGIGRDVTILKHLFGDMGYTVDAVVTRDRSSRPERILKALFQIHRRVVKRPVQVHLEQIHREQFSCAKRNYLFANPELTDPAVFRKFRRPPTILCKSRHAQELFTALKIPNRFVGFTPLDCWDSAVEKDYRRFLHVAGRSRFKGTMALAEVWRVHPEWPELTIIQSAADCYGTPIPVPVESTNIRVISTWLPESELCELQNAAGIHLCPSEMEGYGHYIAEAMSMRAVVVTTDAPPMNELVGPDRGILVAADPMGQSYMSSRVTVNPVALERAIEDLLARPVSELEQLGKQGRTWFLENDAAFRSRMKAIFTGGLR